MKGERGEQGEVGPVGARGGPVSTATAGDHLQHAQSKSPPRSSNCTYFLLLFSHFHFQLCFNCV